MKKESTRDHVDLLMSSKNWPLVYAVDMACDVVAHTEVREPCLASALWGERRGCFEIPKPGIQPQVSILHSCMFIMTLRNFFFFFRFCIVLNYTQKY